MFEGVFKKFTCDNCGGEKFVKGFPRRWLCIAKKGETRHYCFACQTPEEREKMNDERAKLKNYNPNIRFTKED